MLVSNFVGSAGGAAVTWWPCCATLLVIATYALAVSCCFGLLGGCLLPFLFVSCLEEAPVSLRGFVLSQA